MAAFPFNQAAGKFDTDGLPVAAVFPIQQKSYRQMAHFLFGNMDGGKHGIGFLGFVDIVNGNDRGQIPSFFMLFNIFYHFL